MSLSMLVKTNWRISRTQEPKWLLPRPTKTTSLQNSLQLIIMNGGRPTLLFIKEVKYKWRESQTKVKLQLDDVKKTSTGELVVSCKPAPGLHWVFIFETEIFSPEVAMAENSKSGVNFQKIVQQEMKFEVVNKVIGDVVRIAIESLGIEMMKFMMDSMTLHLGMMRTVTTCWS